MEWRAVTTRATLATRAAHGFIDVVTFHNFMDQLRRLFPLLPS